MSVIRYEREGKIAVITIDRLEAMNSLSFQAMEELANAWLRFKDDAEAWVAIVTGAGDKAFCTGLDLKDTISLSEGATIPERQINAFLKYLEIWKPIIAAINGHALGGGTELALACDMRVASENATLGLAEPRWGIMPGAAGTQRLPRAIPLGLAMEMLLTGKRISAQEAFRYGLVNKVVPSGELMSTAKEIASEVCKCGPVAIRAIKEAAIRGLDMSLQQGIALETALLPGVLTSEDGKEGFKSFAEKRKPAFKGR